MQVTAEYHTPSTLLVGTGRWAIDQTENKGVEDYKYYNIFGRSVYIWQLQRYDINEVSCWVGLCG